MTYRCAQGIAVVGVRVCDCGVCLCLPKQRRLVRDIYRPSATALATVGSRPRGRFLGQLYLEEAAGVPVPGLSLMWCLVTCWRFFLRFSSKKKKTTRTPLYGFASPYVLFPTAVTMSQSAIVTSSAIHASELPIFADTFADPHTGIMASLSLSEHSVPAGVVTVSFFTHHLPHSAFTRHHVHS